jgi:hypothetical protein
MKEQITYPWSTISEAMARAFAVGFARVFARGFLRGRRESIVIVGTARKMKPEFSSNSANDSKAKPIHG